MSNVNGKPVGRDADSDFVFDMRSLSRQPGSYSDQARTAKVPEDLNGSKTGLVEVPAGADVALDLRFEAVSEGVLVTGSAVASLTGECARCLDPLAFEVEAGIQELYRYLPDPGEDGEEDEDRFLDGDRLDLEPAFRDALVLALPLAPLCRDDCPGLCPECGVKLAEAGPGHGHGEDIDPRWSALRQLDFPDRVEDRAE
ncbi:MAG: DUF177 domain-containing protein [Nocardiopsaceae bacterium]|nr:DUF177 domain-containing protein [Nocardiopsaceae bacterium]